MPNLSHCQNPFCLALQPQIREKLCTIAAMRTYQAKKTVIIEIGQHGHLFLITKGVAITIKQRPEGKQRGIECLEKGDIIGISNIFREEKDYAIFYTKKETTVCHFPTKDFGDLCSNFPELSCEVIRSLSHRFAQVVINLEHSTLDNSTEKMLYLIQKLSYEQTASSKQVFSFTHEELALLAGINRVTASRVIENLRQADYIIPLGKGKYRIIDHEDQYRQF